MVLVKDGYPRVSIDAPIANVNARTGEREDITTRAYISLNLANDEQRKIFLNHLREQVKTAGISYVETVPETQPNFAGLRWMAEAKGVNLDMIRQLRDYLWNSYKRVINQTKEKLPFDYRPWQEYMIFDVSRRENLMFKGVLEEGLSAENGKDNVSKMFASDGEAECRPYRYRTCDTLIKSQGVSIQARKEVKTVFSTP